MTIDTGASDGDTPRDQRAAARESIFLGAEVHHGGSILTGRVRNISATGAYLEIQAQLAAGDLLLLSFRGFERIAARVTRFAARGVGVHFEEPIDPSRCRQAVLPAGQATHFEPIRSTLPQSPPRTRPRLKLFGVRED